MITYRKSGVNIEAGNELVRRIKRWAPRIGHFSGVFPFSGRSIVATCDGVGSKLKLAFLTGRHDTVGIDLVAMNVNDLLCVGAKPLFFLDYFACGKLNVNTAEKVVRGIVRGCRQAGMALLGGETAEMPGFYKDGEYDLAGFAVGSLRAKPIDGKSVKAGDVLLGLPSSGLHSNGFSLVRKVFSQGELRRRGRELLRPTRIYTRQIERVLSRYPKSVAAICHITGGGFTDNIPRVLPPGCSAVIRRRSWTVPNIFLEIQKKARLPDAEMFRTLNMGIGMILVVRPQDAERVGKLVDARQIGRVVKGNRKIIYQER